ncbi:MAG TPA: response regulator [Candidatus Omnitrophota bacterium]|nr:response regulator [Candidatus Omnitrophota bacterium]
MVRILIVEDEEKVRKMYTEILKNEGYHVTDVPDAVQANEALYRDYFDVMLLDIKLPQVYGSILFDVMQMFHKRIKVIVASVYPIEEQKRIIKNATDYYDKSQGVDILLEKVKNVARNLARQKKVLIIDDEFKIRQLFRSQLEELGYRTFEAEDGESGWELFDRQPDIHLVVLDIALPKKIGVRVFERIKQKTPSTKVIVSSVFPKDDQQLFIWGADDYFDKAEGVDVLTQKVGRLMSSGHEN